MPCAEVLTTLRIRFLDRHVGVSKANLDDVAVVVLDVHRALLPLARRVERLVERHLLALIGVTFFGEGGFHGSSFSTSSACLYSSEFFPNSCLMDLTVSEVTSRNRSSV